MEAEQSLKSEVEQFQVYNLTSLISMPQRLHIITFECLLMCLFACRGD